jgi:hypothetical protein
MSIWTMDIDGKPVVVIGEVDRDEAEDLVGDDSFQEDLMDLESEGEPIWNGEAPLTLREANEEERKAWQESREEARSEEDFDEDEASVVFLIPVSDPDED